MKKMFLILLSLVLFGTVLSCDIGLGKEVDLVAPELKVVSPVNNSFAPKSFKIYGTMKDNEKVESVEIKYSYNDNGEKILKTVKANLIDQEHWEYEFAFDKDYEVTIEVRAYDKNNNSGENTSQTLTVLIDSQDPDASKMGIRRGAYVARLLPVEEFTKEGGKTEMRTSPENKDYFQNVSFLLFSQLKDLNGIKEAILSLYEVNPETKSEALVLGGINPVAGGNIYSPEYSITREMLEGASSSLSSGIHYLRPHIFVKDEAGNHIEKPFEVFAWESAYDIPHVIYRTMEEYKDKDDKVVQYIKVQQGYSIPVTVFDDDGIKSIEYKLIKTSDFSSIGSVSDFVQVQDVSGGIRDKSFEIPTSASTEDGTYKLVVRVIDTGEGAVYLEAIDVRVTNGDAPTIIIDSPVENTVPDLSGSRFTINGHTIDNQPVEKIAIGWLPDGNSDIAKAEAAMESFDFNGDKVIEGIQFYVLTAEDTVHAENKYKNSFSKTYDVFEDFKDSSGNVVNSNKVFMIVAKDTTDNISTKTYRLNAFSSKPTFNVEYSQDNESTWKATENPLVTLPLVKTLFKITPVAKNNMEIAEFTMDGENHRGFAKKDTYIIELTDGNGGDPSSGEVFNINLYAKDKIGNEGRSKLTVAFDEVGVLQSIEANYAKGKIFNKNDKVITLQVNFSSAVEFYPSTAKPTIAIKAKKRGQTSSEAIGNAFYRSGNGTNTLYFDYTIPDGLECSELSLPEGTDPIDTSMCSSLTGKFGGSYETNKEDGVDIFSSLEIDTLDPYILSFTPSNNGIIETKKSLGLDEVGIQIDINFNEAVNIESGTIVIQRADPEGGKWYIPPYLKNEVFLKLYNNINYLTGVGDKSNYKEWLCGSDSNVFKYAEGTIIPEGPYMQYTNGLDMSGTYAVPDTETKYVLAYNLNIADTTTDGKVAKIRTVLEKLGYHKAEFDVTAAKLVNERKTLRLFVKDSDFVDCLRNGVEYFMTLTASSVRDDANNYLPGKEDSEFAIRENEYKFWVGPVATPVIRVDRTATNSSNTRPSAKTEYRIDCETPGATIEYAIDSTMTVAGTTSTTDNEVEHTKAGDIDVSTLKGLSVASLTTNNTGTTDGAAKIGDGSLDTAQKIYIKAVARKTGFTASEGYEGAYKTVLHYKYTKGTTNTLTRIHGSQAPEGTSSVAGFPLQLNNTDTKTYQVPYKNSNDYYWVSWQMVTDWTLQTYFKNFQDPADPKCSYGQYIYCLNKSVYGGY